MSEEQAVPLQVTVKLQPIKQEDSFPSAEQPDIIRSVLKDSYFKHLFNTQSFDAACQVLGPGLSMHWKEELQVLSEVLYYGLSILPGRQTLGEEYCDIVQVNPYAVPLTSKERLYLLFCQTLLPYFYNKIIQKLTILSRPRLNIPIINPLFPNASLNQQQQEGGGVGGGYELSKEMKEMLDKYLPQITAFINILGRIHIAVFYFSGDFYEFAKRLSSVRYVFNRKYRDEERQRYTILGILIFLQLGISFFIFMKRTLTPKNNDVFKEEESKTSNIGPSTDTGICSLCLEPRKNATATSCGHLFCWNCIVEWCNNKAECPLDRSPLKKSELVCVYGI